MGRSGFVGEDPELKLGHVQEELSLECGNTESQVLGSSLPPPTPNTGSSSLSPGAGQKHPHVPYPVPSSPFPVAGFPFLLTDIPKLSGLPSLPGPAPPALHSVVECPGVACILELRQNE